MQDHTQVTSPKLPGSHGVWIPPLANELIVGEIKSHADALGVSSLQIPGYWIHKDRDLEVGEPPSPGEKIVYYAHGGAYVVHTAHPDGRMAIIPKGFLEHCPTITRTFAVEYRLLRLSAKPVHPFPTAFIDTLAGYTYLVGLGFKEENIVLCGDSAGGNLALALTRYLIDNRDTVPSLPRAPGALVLISPWADVSESLEVAAPQSATELPVHDWMLRMDSEEMGRIVKAFLGYRPDEIENAERHVYSAPASPYLLGLTSDSTTRKVWFKDFPPTWIDFGGSEVLRDQIRRLGMAMEEDLGKGKFVMNECPGGVHDYVMFDWYEPERSESMRKIAAWLEDV